MLELSRKDLTDKIERSGGNPEIFIVGDNI